MQPVQWNWLCIALRLFIGTEWAFVVPSLPLFRRCPVTRGMDVQFPSACNYPHAEFVWDCRDEEGCKLIFCQTGPAKHFGKLTSTRQAEAVLYQGVFFGHYGSAIRQVTQRFLST